MNRVHAALVARVYAALAPRETLLDPLRAELTSLKQDLGAIDGRARALERQITHLQREISAWNSPFHADMTIAQALGRHPSAQRVFAAHHLPACDGCAVRFDETLAEAAAAYNLDLSGLLARLNDLLAGG